MTKIEIIGSVVFILIGIIGLKPMIYNFKQAYNNQIPSISEARRIALMFYFGLGIVLCPLICGLLLYLMYIRLI
ncbi:hypothetical protein [Bdellovibrio svalbardensis]|uniref:Uncharacterized protein n=1 Tax=Bdellovibrio svalbardensis TaxID=2972972 RepID=A0ABT6DJP7_9BACT|nr:hypothetical protein [Bdellovibrio svalbardensis]MDG0816440.1 hypothetical protein [Bdellovibrio svalbardensis]